MTQEELDTEIEELEAQLDTLQAEIYEVETQIEDFDAGDWIGEDQYDDFLDEIYPEVEVAGIRFYPSAVLYNMDPTAYNIGFGEFVDNYDMESISEYKDLTDQLDSMTDDLDSLESDLQDLQNEEPEED